MCRKFGKYTTKQEQLICWSIQFLIFFSVSTISWFSKNLSGIFRKIQDNLISKFVCMISWLFDRNNLFNAWNNAQEIANSEWKIHRINHVRECNFIRHTILHVENVNTIWFCESKFAGKIQVKFKKLQTCGLKIYSKIRKWRALELD